MQTVIPDSIEALWLMVATQFQVTQPEVDVLDGPSIEDFGRDVVAIGIAMDEAEQDSSFDVAGLETDRETFDMVCMVRSWTGDPELSERRRRAFQLFEEITAIIKSDPKLKGTVARARVSNVAYMPARLPEGALATVTFRVRIDAFTR